MNEDFVTYDLAVKLKEKGFDSFCENGYFLKNGIEYSIPNDNSVLVSSIGEIIFNTELCWFEEEIEYGRDIIYAPTISQVLKWLRKEKNVHIGFGYSPRKKWRYVVMYMDDRFYNKPTLAVDGFLNIEQAALVGIEYVIDNLI